MKILYGLLTIALMASCSSKNVCVLDKNSETNLDNNIYISAEVGEEPKSDFYNVDTAYVINDNLYMDIHFGGGCMAREYKFYGAQVVTMSIPAKQQVSLILIPADDRCKKLSYQSIVIDLKELKSSQGGSKFLLLNGWDKEIEYKY